MNYLLIETQDQRKFVTYEKYADQLSEFIKTFSAKTSVIQSDDVKPMQLKELVNAFCNQNYCSGDFEYKIIKNQNQTTEIKEFVYNKFINREIVSVNKIKKDFSEYKLSSATYNKIIQNVIKKLEKQGYKSIKIKNGQYKIETSF